MPSTGKACMNCNWCAIEVVPVCSNPKLATDPVSGHITSRTCSDMRSDETKCGAEGRYFEAKPIAVPPMPPTSPPPSSPPPKAA